MQRPPLPFGYEPYVPPGFGGQRPAVILWYRVYATTVVVVYGGFFVLRALLTPEARSAAPQEVQATMAAVALTALFLAFGAFFVLAALVPYKPWGWIIGLIAICLGLSSCMVVAAVPLLVYWLRPETKAAFGRL